MRRGRGFMYVDEHGARVSDEATLDRVRELAIPPAWHDVWICEDPRGHLQAIGTDAAGRTQYLYHPNWRAHRDRAKYRRMVEFALALPRLRRRVDSDLDTIGLTRERVLGGSVRLLDLGMFRIGGEEYAEHGGGLGLATLRREHASVRDQSIVFDYPAKGGVRRVHEVADRPAAELVAGLKSRRGGPDELLVYRDGRRLRALRSEEINNYIKAAIGEDFSAKDFRTWNATVLASVMLAADRGREPTKTARKRAISECVQEVANLLGNTPAVARRAYIDPRVFDRFQSGLTIRPRVEASTLDRISARRRRTVELAVLDLLTDEAHSSRVGSGGGNRAQTASGGRGAKKSN